MQYIRTSDNVKLAVYDQNMKGKETILMIHGWPLSHRMYEYQVQMLLYHDYRVITMDLRGFGLSDAPSFPYDYDRMADDIRTVVRALNLRSFILAGFSMGGAIVCRYMGRHGGFGVRKLALLAAAAPALTRRPDFPYGVAKEAVDQWIEGASTDRPKLCASFGKMLFATPKSPELLEWFQDLSFMASGVGTVQTAYALRDEDCRADMGKIHVPTAIFHGRKDEIVPYELGVVQHQMIAGSMMCTFENSGHGIFYDELADFNQAFLQFLQEK